MHLAGWYWPEKIKPASVFTLSGFFIPAYFIMPDFGMATRTSLVTPGMGGYLKAMTLNGDRLV